MEFGTDGFRGNAKNFSNEGIKRIGYELAKTGFLGKIVIGYDTRFSCENIKQNLILSINAANTQVIDLGITTTPALAYSSKVIADAKYGVMITASHNPYYDNGIKIFKNGNKINSNLEEILLRAYNNNTFIVKSNAEKLISTRDDTNYIKYIDFNDELKNKFKGKKIIVDTANGAAYSLAKKIFSTDNFEFISDKPNGYNINENCGVMHPKKLSMAVLKNKAYFGVAFDGDCDRVLFCDEKGEIIDMDHLIGWIANDMIEKNELKNKGIVVTNYSNLALDSYVKSIGANVFRVENGDKAIFAKMNEINYNFGAEKTGHIIFGNYLGTGDGFLSAKEVISRLDVTKSVSSQIRPFELNPQIVLNIPIRNKIPFSEIKNFDKIESKIKSKLNGFGRLFIRYSGTENLCRIMIESKNKMILNEIGFELSSLFSNI